MPKPPQRPLQEPLLPMINVVFLLLIFFLIAARMTPPEPFSITPPLARDGAEAGGDFTLYLGAGGQIGFADATADAALVALEADRQTWCATTDCDMSPPHLTLRADAALPATDLAVLLPRLAGLGFGRVELVTKP